MYHQSTLSIWLNTPFPKPCFLQQKTDLCWIPPIARTKVQKALAPLPSLVGWECFLALFPQELLDQNDLHICPKESKHYLDQHKEKPIRNKNNNNNINNNNNDNINNNHSNNQSVTPE